MPVLSLCHRLVQSRDITVTRFLASVFAVMGLPVAVAPFLSSRIPFLLSNAVAFHVTTTAPNEPPKQSEQDAVKKGRWERIFASTISWLPPLAKVRQSCIPGK